MYGSLMEAKRKRKHHDLPSPLRHGPGNCSSLGEPLDLQRDFTNEEMRQPSSQVIYRGTEMVNDVTDVRQDLASGSSTQQLITTDGSLVKLLSNANEVIHYIYL